MSNTISGYEPFFSMDLWYSILVVEVGFSTFHSFKLKLLNKTPRLLHGTALFTSYIVQYILALAPTFAPPEVDRNQFKKATL